jgi:hypothetical protein
MIQVASCAVLVGVGPSAVHLRLPLGMVSGSWPNRNGHRRPAACARRYELLDKLPAVEAENPSRGSYLKLGVLGLPSVRLIPFAGANRPIHAIAQRFWSLVASFGGCASLSVNSEPSNKSFFGGQRRSRQVPGVGTRFNRCWACLQICFNLMSQTDPLLRFTR